MRSAYGPIAANEYAGCRLRFTPGHVRKSSGILPMPVVGVLAGSNAGSSARMTSVQLAGTGGDFHLAGSVSCVECDGMTSVPSGPRASRRGRYYCYFAPAYPTQRAERRVHKQNRTTLHAERA